MSKKLIKIAHKGCAFALKELIILEVLMNAYLINIKLYYLIIFLIILGKFFSIGNVR